MDKVEDAALIANDFRKNDLLGIRQSDRVSALVTTHTTRHVTAMELYAPPLTLVNNKEAHT